MNLEKNNQNLEPNNSGGNKNESYKENLAYAGLKIQFIFNNFIYIRDTIEEYVESMPIIFPESFLSKLDILKQELGDRTQEPDTIPERKYSQELTDFVSNLIEEFGALALNKKG